MQALVCTPSQVMFVVWFADFFLDSAWVETRLEERGCLELDKDR